MACKHDEVTVGTLRVSRRETGIALHVENVVCKRCKTPFIVAASEVEQTRLGFTVRLQPHSLSHERLKCPHCGRRLFGHPIDGARLSNAPIVEVVCGIEHTVVQADGGRLSFRQGEIRRVEEEGNEDEEERDGRHSNDEPVGDAVTDGSTGGRVSSS